MGCLRRDGIIILSSGVLASTSITICLRFMTRKFVAGKLRIDDWLMLCAWAFCITHCILDLATAQLGVGLHGDEVSISNLPALLKILVTNEINYTMTIYFGKLSILIFFLDFIPRDTKSRYSVFVMICFLNIFTFTCVVGLLCQCVPLSALWDQNVTGRCISVGDFFYFISATNMATDLIIFCLPLKWLWTIKRSTSEKILIISVFSLSLLACATGIPRIIEIGQFSENCPYDNDLLVWSQLEGCLGIICGSAPAIKPLFCCRRKKGDERQASDSVLS